MRIIDDITIHSSRVDRKIKPRQCHASLSTENHITTFILEETQRWFELAKFIPETGFTITTSNGDRYVITGIAFAEKRPMVGHFTAVKISSGCVEAA